MSDFVFREIESDESFDPLSITPHAPFTQASFYGEWQKKLGREVKRVVVSRDGRPVAYFQLIQYPLLLGKSYWYIPYGPVIKDFSEPFLAAMKEKLTATVREQNAVFIRLDFTPRPQTDEERHMLETFFRKASPYTYHAAYFQPRAEWFLPLEPSESDLLAGMHKNTRYSIRTAEKKGITSHSITTDFKKYFLDFYRLMLETATRNGFRLHEKKYYEYIFETLHSLPNAYLSIAKYQEEVLVVDLVIVYGPTATHVFGGSSDAYREWYPSYAAQWEAIRHAKKIGCAYYNFGGIASGSSYRGWDGLTAFKKKFGGREVYHSDFFDVVLKPLWYYLYVLRKRLKALL